jgi:type II secretory pathway pseudopilin PulG
MSIIIILIGLLVPALNEVRRFAKDVKQNAQLHSINVALELFEKENEGLPPSDEEDDNGVAYCGAMKLAEAMLGQDLLGYFRDTKFNADCLDDDGDKYYEIGTGGGPFIPPNKYDDNLSSRRSPYLQLENANAVKMKNLYSNTAISGSDFSSTPNIEEIYVLTDVYTRVMSGEDGSKRGMPILYYKADPSGNVNPNEDNGYAYDTTAADERRIYKYEDNDDLVKMDGTGAVPWTGNMKHYMSSDITAADPGDGPLEDFYWRINNDNISINDGRPYRSDSYILISAGDDGLYGTRDDIMNFQKR